MKFNFKCTHCQKEFANFQEWFDVNQVCPQCGKTRIETIYHSDYKQLKDLIFTKTRTNYSIWHYFDFLPLQNEKNIISTPDSPLGIDQWTFLEDFAKKIAGIDITVHAYRNDKRYGTGTFKDPGASLAASVLKENNIKEYIVASTGNVANAFAYYLAEAGVSLNAFVPQDSLELNTAGVSCFGQKPFRVNGDYHLTKKIASEYAKKYGILMTSGNCDPLRVEAKRTMVFDWLQRMKKFPNVYIQALSGGTGPIAIDKAIREISPLQLIEGLPRFIMVQPNGCSPMYQGYQTAKENNFPPHWAQNYPVIENPITQVPTLATGNPGTFPIIAELVKKSDGDIIEINENKLAAVARWVAYEKIVSIGPAAATAVAGFIKSVQSGAIKNGDNVLLNIGEGIQRAPEFLIEMNYTEQTVNSVDDCPRFNRESLKQKLEKEII